MDASEGLVFENFVWQIDVEDIFNEVKAHAHPGVLSSMRHILLQCHHFILDTEVSLWDNGVHGVGAVFDEAFIELRVRIFETSKEANNKKGMSFQNRVIKKKQELTPWCCARQQTLRRRCRLAH